MFGDVLWLCTACLKVRRLPKICKANLLLNVTAILLLASFENHHTKVMGDENVDCSRPPLDIHPKDCCRMPTLLDEALLQGCKEIHGGEELKRGVAHEKGSCFIECAMKATGTLVNGVLDQAKIVQLIASRTISNPALTQVFITVCVKCFQSARPRAPSYDAEDKKYCASTAADFVSCVNMETFKLCLPEYWTSSNSCSTLRKYIESCPVPTS